MLDLFARYMTCHRAPSASAPTNSLGEAIPLNPYHTAIMRASAASAPVSLPPELAPAQGVTIERHEEERVARAQGVIIERHQERVARAQMKGYVHQRNDYGTAPVLESSSVSSSSGCLPHFTKEEWLHLFVAFMGAATAPNGAFTASNETWDQPKFNLIMSLLAWGGATYINFDASPVSNLKQIMKAGIKPGKKDTVLKVMSAGAAICSGFLAIATPYKLWNLISKIFFGNAISIVTWPAIAIGLIFCFFNTKSSWNIGNAAISSFARILPRIKTDFDEHPFITGAAVLLAVVMNLLVTFPYADGIAGGTATFGATDGDVHTRFEAMILGKEVDNKSLFKILYWTIFGVGMIPNLVALTTFTFAPCYEFYFDFIYTLTHVRESIVQTRFGNTGKEKISFKAAITATCVAGAITYAYGSTFGGFTIGTLKTSPLGKAIPVSDRIKTIASIIAAASTWGVMIFDKLYGQTYRGMHASLPGRNAHYVKLQALVSLLNQYDSKGYKKIIYPQNGPIVLNSADALPNLQCPTLYASPAPNAWWLTASPVMPKSSICTADGLIELMVVIFIAEDLTSLYETSIEKIELGNADPTSTKEIEYEIMMPATEHIRQESGVYNPVTTFKKQTIHVTAEYNHGGRSRLVISLNSPPHAGPVDMTQVAPADADIWSSATTRPGASPGREVVVQPSMLPSDAWSTSPADSSGSARPFVNTSYVMPGHPGDSYAPFEDTSVDRVGLHINQFSGPANASRPSQTLQFSPHEMCPGVFDKFSRDDIVTLKQVVQNKDLESPRVEWDSTLNGLVYELVSININNYLNYGLSYINVHYLREFLQAKEADNLLRKLPVVNF